VSSQGIPFLSIDALPNICVSSHCLQTAEPGSHYCKPCGRRVQMSDLELSGDIIIYAIQAESGPVNIGTTTNLKRRLVDLQVGNHEKLTIIGHCTARPSLGSDLLMILGTDKIRGKWLKRSAEVTKTVLFIKDGTEALQKYIASKAYQIT